MAEEESATSSDWIGAYIIAGSVHAIVGGAVLLFVNNGYSVLAASVHLIGVVLSGIPVYFLHRPYLRQSKTPANAVQKPVLAQPPPDLVIEINGMLQHVLPGARYDVQTATIVDANGVRVPDGAGDKALAEALAQRTKWGITPGDA